jgi:hypothetical protein
MRKVDVQKRGTSDKEEECSSREGKIEKRQTRRELEESVRKIQTNQTDLEV